MPDIEFRGEIRTLFGGCRDNINTQRREGKGWMKCTQNSTEFREEQAALNPVLQYWECCSHMKVTPSSQRQLHFPLCAALAGACMACGQERLSTVWIG